ncbi:MAG: flagellar biosynthetic protein FliO [Geminicoccaceae bacterium]|nr:flagellar biosynthetic protein FliO [Geminicoccaceae bacterium]
MDEVGLLRAAIALMFVLGLIGIITWLARRLRLLGFAPGGPGRRLEMIETLVIDPRHKVVLIRNDDEEHLLLLGPSAPLMLERRTVPVPVEPEAG